MAGAGGGGMTPPTLLLLEAFGGHWNAYEAELNRIFMEEIARGGVRFRDWPVNCRRIPEAGGRWASYWHLVQEGRVEDDRTPDMRRCERIRWVRWIIESAVTHPEIDEWQNVRGTETNTLLWYGEEYLVVLTQRKDYWLLKTAYCTQQRRRIEQLRRERDAFLRAAEEGRKKG
jgi:hypothetical protein